MIIKIHKGKQMSVQVPRHIKLCYRDKEGKELTIEQLEPLLRDPDYKVIKQEQIGKYFISTVWLGVPHGMGCHYFETMVFLTPEAVEDRRESLGKTMECYRYCTKEEALEGHLEVIKEWKDKC
jgi:hypothetical protein